MKKLITVVVGMMLVGSAYAQHGQPSRCYPQQRQCYPSRSHHSNGGLSISFGFASRPVCVQQPQFVCAPQVQPQIVYVQQQAQVQPQIVYVQQQAQVQPQIVYASQQPQVQQQVFVQQQSPVYVAPAPQVGGLLPQMPAEQPVPQVTVPISPNTKVSRTTTTWQSSSMSTTTERFEW